MATCGRLTQTDVNNMYQYNKFYIDMPDHINYTEVWSVNSEPLCIAIHYKGNKENVTYDGSTCMSYVNELERELYKKLAREFGLSS